MAVRPAGASGGSGAVLRKTIGMRSAIGLRHPASASCLGRHLRLAGRCPNNSSLFPPLAAVVVVVLCAYSAEKILIIEQCRAVCGPPGIAFSRVGSWRKTASAALVSCGNSRAAGRTLSGSRRSPAVPLSGFAIFPRPGEVVPLRRSFLPSVGQRERSSPFGGAGAGAPERVCSLPLGKLASRSDD